jgi:hypothetical protein
MSFCKNCITGSLSSSSSNERSADPFYPQVFTMMALRRVRLVTTGRLRRPYSDLIAPRRAGKWEEINGVNSYVATPSVDHPKDKAILLLTDVFGPQLVNAQVRLLFYFFVEEGS